VARPGGTVALYVWDYAGEMQMMRRFWDAAVALDPAARNLDEGRRFVVCQPEALRRLVQRAGLDADETVSGDQEFTVIGTADFTGPGQIRSFTTATDTYLLLNTDNDVMQEATIQLAGVYAPQPGWFVL
jgi:hypothetical protein